MLTATVKIQLLHACNFYIVPIHLLPFGFSAGDQLVPPSIDGPSPPLDIPGGGIPFYGTQESVLYVCMYLYCNNAITVHGAGKDL